jgi:hypothetical protein
MSVPHAIAKTTYLGRSSLNQYSALITEPRLIDSAPSLIPGPDLHRSTLALYGHRQSHYILLCAIYIMIPNCLNRTKHSHILPEIDCNIDTRDPPDSAEKRFGDIQGDSNKDLDRDLTVELRIMHAPKTKV